MITRKKCWEDTLKTFRSGITGNVFRQFFLIFYKFCSGTRFEFTRIKIPALIRINYICFESWCAQVRYCYDELPIIVGYKISTCWALGRSSANGQTMARGKKRWRSWFSSRIRKTTMPGSIDSGLSSALVYMTERSILRESFWSKMSTTTRRGITCISVFRTQRAGQKKSERSADLKFLVNDSKKVIVGTRNKFVNSERNFFCSWETGSSYWQWVLVELPSSHSKPHSHR